MLLYTIGIGNLRSIRNLSIWAWSGFDSKVNGYVSMQAQVTNALTRVTKQTTGESNYAFAA